MDYMIWLVMWQNGAGIGTAVTAAQAKSTREGQPQEVTESCEVVQHIILSPLITKMNCDALGAVLAIPRPPRFRIALDLDALGSSDYSIG